MAGVSHGGTANTEGGRALGAAVKRILVCFLGGHMGKSVGIKL